MGGFLVARIAKHCAVVVESVQVTFGSLVSGHRPIPEECPTRRPSRIVGCGGAGIEASTYTAMFHEVGGVWKLRGIRLLCVGTLAKPVDVGDDPKK